MSSVTGTQDAGPATPLVVPPRGAVSGAEITGTTAAAPATPLVVPGLRTALPVAAVAVPKPAHRPTRHASKPIRPTGSLAATGEPSIVGTIATLLVGGALWLRRRGFPSDG